MPSSSAAMSIICSRARVSIIHGPRYGTRPTTFVQTVRLWKRTLGMRYGPENIISTPPAALMVPPIGYAPASSRWSRSAPRMCPSASKAIVTVQRSLRDVPPATRFSRRSSIHFNGRPRYFDGERDTDLLAAEERLQAEAAADVLLHDADSGLGDAERPGEHRAHVVRVLVGDPHPERALVGIPLRDDAPRLHGNAEVPVLRERSREHVRRGREDLVELGIRLRGDLGGDVGPELRVDDVLVVVGGRLVVDHGGERLVLDVDRVAAVLGNRATLGHHDRDRVAHEPDVALGEWPDRRVRHLLREQRRAHRTDAGVEVLGGEDGVHAGHLPARRTRRAAARSPRDVAAEERDVEQPGEGDVVDERADVPRAGGVLAAQDRRPDEPTGDRGRRAVARHRR